MGRIDKIEFEQREASLTHTIAKELLKEDGFRVVGI